MQAYRALDKRLRRISGLSDAASMLAWDQAVMMPKGANAARGEQLAVLASMQHELLVADDTRAWLEAAGDEDLDEWQKANLRETWRQYRHAACIPAELVEALTLATNRCEMNWRTARQESRFADLRADLEEVFRLKGEAALLKGRALGLSPYDALLDEFQPGLHSRTIEPLFAELAQALPPMIERAIARQGEVTAPKGPFAVDKQRALAKSMMAQLGFDFERGRLDESTHPFCGGVPGDIRITTRYREEEVVSALMGTLHETGHALYEAGLPQDYRQLPVGQNRGMTVHESQSLLMEMQACRSPAFVSYLAGRLAEAFGDDAGFESPNLQRLYTRVGRGFIRVDADELTYPLHIALRFELERRIIDGNLEVADLPEAWNEGMQRYLGVTPPDDAHGVLQDIHWPVGAIGYFPSYTLGAVLAAQLFQAAVRAVPGLDAAIGRGDFAPLLGWLRQNIHGYGCFFEMNELILQATGKKLGCDDFLEHLERRYQ